MKKILSLALVASLAISLVACGGSSSGPSSSTPEESTPVATTKSIIPVFGVDAIPEAMAEVEAGFLVGSVVNDALNQAQATFDLAFNAAQGKEVLADTDWKLDENKAVRVPYLAAGAGYVPATEPASPNVAKAGDKKVIIGVTIYRYDDNFMSFVRREIERAASNVKESVELKMNDSKGDQATQKDQVEQMIAQGVNALAINLVDPPAAASIIALAKEAKLPLVFFNKEPSAADMASYDKCWFVGTASAESGIIQGQMIADSWKANPDWDKNGDGKMSYVMIKGEPGHPDAEARTKYSIDTVISAGIAVDKLEEDTGMWDTAKAKDKMDAWIAKHGDDIEVIICNNDGMAIGVIQSLRAAGYSAPLTK